MVGALGLGVGDYIHMLEKIPLFCLLHQRVQQQFFGKMQGKQRKLQRRCRITAADLKEFRCNDEIIPEAKGGAHRNVLNETVRNYLDLMLRKTFEQLNGISKDELIEKRL